ncbi:unnamed protein product [Rhizophagus irregularis]|nr:unnamed protein product [Rhizophagus irregularis]
MDFNSNNEKKNKRNRYFNIIFLGIFLTEIITYIIGIVILPIRSDWLIMPVSVIFISGIYTFFKKTLLYLSAFCVVNMIQCIILIDFARFYRYTIFHEDQVDLSFLEYVTKQDVFNVKFSNDSKLHGLFNKFDEFDEKEYRTIFIIPIIIAIVLIIVFVILYIVLIFITWKNEYWDFISRTKILIPNDKIKKFYIIYKFYNFLLYILLNLIVVFNLSDTYNFFFRLRIYTSPYLEFNIIIKAIKILSLFTLTLSLKIIRKELKFDQMLSINNMPALPLSRILGLILLGLTFINTILCHINFGKHHIFLLKFNPNLDKEYEYLNDLDDDDDDDEEEEEEKDEKISEKLNRYWKFIKKLSRIGQEH